MTAQDAREQAWEFFRETELALNTHYMAEGMLVLIERVYKRAWDAAKREDEQRIAALVAAFLWKHTGRIGISWEDAVANRPYHALVLSVQRETEEFMRALAGQTEELK